MGHKELYADALWDLPDLVKNNINTVVPDIAATWLPDTEADANIVCGMLAHNINQILFMHQGLSLVQLALRIGTHNPALRDMLLAGLEFIGSSEPHDFSVTSPSDGDLIPPGDASFAIQITSGLTDFVLAQVEVDGQTHTLTLVEGTTDHYENTFGVTEGNDQTAIFRATFETDGGSQYIAAHSVLFHVGV